jgi:hypothetical protein
MVTNHMALVGLWHIKEELYKGFPSFQIKFPSTQTLREKIISSNHISNINYLDEHEFPNDICSQASRCEVWNKAYASQPKETSRAGRAQLHEFDFSR